MPRRMMEAAVRHGVFDLLDRGPQTVEEVARLSGTSLRGMRALLNAFAGLQLLTRDEDGDYGPTSGSATSLVSG